jgi:ATPase subunit of ABC transporter with duplicated ATPase domains
MNDPLSLSPSLCPLDEAVVNMYFPTPTWSPGIGEDGTILVRTEDLTFGVRQDTPLLKDVTLSLHRGSKVALVGRNSCGKSTLVNLIVGSLGTSSNGTHFHGELWSHPSIRIGHVTQYSVEELEEYRSQTVVEYAETKLRAGKASASIVAKTSGNVRQYHIWSGRQARSSTD